MRYTTAQARRVAEASGLADALTAHDADERVWDQALALLLRMVCADDHRTEIDRYPDARRVLTLVAAGSARVTPTPRRCADLAALVVDLRTGAAACLDWAEYEREAVLDRFLSVLRSPPWRRTLEGAVDSCAVRRNRWIRDVLDRNQEALGRNRFEVHVVRPVAPGRSVSSGVTTRILLDGRPVIAEFFPQGSGEAPEKLLRRPGLWATEQPRRVRLAEANCAEGCCGAMDVTIVRELDRVVWRDWATPGPVPPEFRFHAVEYDLEVAGAEYDHASEWSGWASTSRDPNGSGALSRPLPPIRSGGRLCPSRQYG
ncbi:hypothetical protein [Nocardia tenerifensis]|uniref:hypothetical protein n=1 Tax=Nocardia tenerifensis TaxID=228006 RepID=UPI0002F50879|nr:hypothetical protein [Nocardia tenerifensis]